MCRCGLAQQLWWLFWCWRRQQQEKHKKTSNPQYVGSDRPVNPSNPAFILPWPLCNYQNKSTDMFWALTSPFSPQNINLKEKKRFLQSISCTLTQAFIHAFAHRLPDHLNFSFAYQLRGFGSCCVINRKMNATWWPPDNPITNWNPLWSHYRQRWSQMAAERSSHLSTSLAFPALLPSSHQRKHLSHFSRIKMFVIYFLNF